MPGSKPVGGSKVADAVVKIIELEEQIKRDMENLVELKSEIMSVISDIENIEYQLVLEKRYLSLLSWEQIAVDMNLSMQHLYRIHSMALKKICIPGKVESK